MKKKHVLSFVLLVGLLAGHALGQVSVGAKVPHFVLENTEGQEYELLDFQGKIVVLEWINTDCPFVKKHYDSENMQALQKTYTAQGVIWLAIASSAPGKQGHYEAADWKKKIEESSMAATHVLLDAAGDVGRMYGAKTTPHMFVINADGVLVYDGAIDSDRSTDPEAIKGAENYVASVLDALLAGAEPPISNTVPYGCSVKY